MKIVAERNSLRPACAYEYTNLWNNEAPASLNPSTVKKIIPNDEQLVEFVKSFPLLIPHMYRLQAFISSEIIGPAVRHDDAPQRLQGHVSNSQIFT